MYPVGGTGRHTVPGPAVKAPVAGSAALVALADSGRAPTPHPHKGKPASAPDHKKRPVPAARPACAVYIATSLDGYIARADGGLDWLKAVEREGEDYGYADFAATVDTLLLGRKTYDTVLTFGAWPYGDKRCLVLTHRPAAPRYTERFVSGTPAEVLAAVPEAKKIYVDGGDVIRQFLQAGLVDELTLSTVPILLGGGIPLFAPGFPERRFQLVRSTSYPSGLVQSHYRSLP